ncbi:hypothetical protein G6N82_10645 [Altererythrobacter sp. BO-6]|uniref:hypothetical protein n=1 Tax=Altererythrobacter sp. BO-6 TaxID=2604537 RepID=UPI0013E1AA2C|nr:hypothetical protein [Altererythrobacter sp. BO-6]QIG54551.1 hypothetical protein G6N82_10645 [Altererythrobacter sp. BO-6]
MNQRNNQHSPLPDGSNRSGRGWWIALILGAVLLAAAAGWWIARDMVSATAVDDGLAPAGVGAKAEPAANDQDVAAGAIRDLGDAQQLALAMEAVFGAGRPSIRASEDVVFDYSDGRLVWTEFGPVLVMAGAHPDASPVVTGTLGIFYLRETQDTRFELVRSWPDEVLGGIMSNPPEWSIRNDVARNPVITSQAGGVWQGYACDTGELTELAPDGPRQLLLYPAYYDNSGALDETGEREFYRATIRNVVPGQAFDVQYAGSVNVTHRYARKGGSYRRTIDTASGDAELPQC